MKRVPKILMAATSGKDFSGGAPRSFLNLCLELKKLGFNIIVWVPDKGKLEQKCRDAGLECVRGYELNEWKKPLDKKITIKKKFKLKIKRIINTVTYKSQKEAIRKISPDFVHINAITMNYRLANIANELKIPVVWHIREFLEEDLNSTFIDEYKQINILNRARGFIGISNEIKKKWNTRVKPQIYTVYNGVNADDYCVENKMILAEKCNVILYGRIAKGKNQLFFLRGINRLVSNKSNLNSYFYLAGPIEDKEYFDKCKEYIKNHNLQKYVSYIGEVTDVKKMLSSQNIVCVCSAKEGFGRVNVEALMGKCLVVASDSGANKEIITDGKNGYIYKHDNLNSFVENLSKAINTRNRFDYDKIQKDAIHNYSAERNAKDVVKVYKNLELI